MAGPGFEACIGDQGKCFTYTLSVASSDGNNIVCPFGSTVGSIISREEQRLFESDSMPDFADTWLGLRRDTDTWSWTDGAGFRFMGWRSGSPSGSGTSCAHLDSDRHWVEAPCDGTERRAVCKQEIDGEWRRTMREGR